MTEQTLPAARKKGLVVQEVGEETLVYDLERHRAYCLNRTAALVWRHCDGQASVHQAANALSDELRAPASEEMVWLALRRLERARLVEGRVTESVPMDYARREMLKRLAALGIAAAFLPSIVSVMAPQAAQAATCVTDCSNQPVGTPCEPPNCTKICCGNVAAQRKCQVASHPTCP